MTIRELEELQDIIPSDKDVIHDVKSYASSALDAISSIRLWAMDSHKNDYKNDAHIKHAIHQLNSCVNLIECHWVHERDNDN